MLETPQVTQSTPQHVARIHLTIPREQIREVMGPGIMEVMGAVQAQGLRPTGAWLTHHLRMDPATFDFDICVPVDRPVTPVGRVQPGRLEGRRVARVVYCGPYEGLHTAWSELRSWIAAQGHTCAPDLWEVYAVGPETGPDGSKYRTELNQPLA